MKARYLLVPIIALAILLAGTSAFCDIIYMKDGSVIKGKIIKETEDYVEVEVRSRSGGRLSTKIARSKIRKIEYEDEEAKESPAPSGTPQPAAIERAVKLAEEAVEFYKAGDFDSFLDRTVKMMKLTRDLPDFKKAYSVIEEALKKPLPDLLEREMKRQCNKVVHYKPFMRLCPTCKGAGKIERIVNGKRKKITCPTCKGKGGVPCPTCAKRMKLAERYRKLVRYTEEELKYVAWFRVLSGNLPRKVADRLTAKLFSGAKLFEMDRGEKYVKYEVRLKKQMVEEFAASLRSNGASVSVSTLDPHLYIVRLD